MAVSDQKKHFLNLSIYTEKNKWTIVNLDLEMNGSDDFNQLHLSLVFLSLWSHF